MNKSGYRAFMLILSLEIHNFQQKQVVNSIELVL